jgi:hypothetical protein
MASCVPDAIIRIGRASFGTTNECETGAIPWKDRARAVCERTQPYDSRAVWYAQPPLTAVVSSEAMRRRAPCHFRKSRPLRSIVVSMTRPDFTLAWMKRPSPR